MNVKEIIENLCLIDNIVPDYLSGRRRGLTDDETEKLAYRAVYQAVEILEKLVSTKPRFEPSGAMYGFYYCSNCDAMIPTKANYCSNCGQKIDWNKDKENCKHRK